MCTIPSPGYLGVPPIFSVPTPSPGTTYPPTTCLALSHPNLLTPSLSQADRHCRPWRRGGVGTVDISSSHLPVFSSGTRFLLAPRHAPTHHTLLLPCMHGGTVTPTHPCLCHVPSLPFLFWRATTYRRVLFFTHANLCGDSQTHVWICKTQQHILVTCTLSL